MFFFKQLSTWDLREYLPCQPLNNSIYFTPLFNILFVFHKRNSFGVYFIWILKHLYTNDLNT